MAEQTLTSSTELQRMDLEFSGSIARSAEQGAKFALMLAMLEQNVLKRTRVVSPPEPDPFALSDEVDNQYRHYPLKAEQKHWQSATQAAEMIHQQPIADARLWLSMHPDPLSIFNDAGRIESDVATNTSFHTQLALKKPFETNEIDVDETQLFEVLQTLPDAVQIGLNIT